MFNFNFIFIDTDATLHSESFFLFLTVVILIVWTGLCSLNLDKLSFFVIQVVGPGSFQCYCNTCGHLCRGWLLWVSLVSRVNIKWYFLYVKCVKWHQCHVWTTRLVDDIIFSVFSQAFFTQWKELHPSGYKKTLFELCWLVPSKDCLLIIQIFLASHNLISYWFH